MAARLVTVIALVLFTVICGTERMPAEVSPAGFGMVKVIALRLVSSPSPDAMVGTVNDELAAPTSNLWDAVRVVADVEFNVDAPETASVTPAMSPFLLIIGVVLADVLMPEVYIYFRAKIDYLSKAYSF